MFFNFSHEEYLVDIHSHKNAYSFVFSKYFLLYYLIGHKNPQKINWELGFIFFGFDN